MDSKNYKNVEKNQLLIRDSDCKRTFIHKRRVISPFLENNAQWILDSNDC